jgi:hypothetical protein
VIRDEKVNFDGLKVIDDTRLARTKIMKKQSQTTKNTGFLLLSNMLAKMV